MSTAADQTALSRLHQIRPALYPGASPLLDQLDQLQLQADGVILGVCGVTLHTYLLPPWASAHTRRCGAGFS